MDPNIIIAEIEDYSRKSGLKPTTICQRAVGNARLYERLQRRIGSDTGLADSLRKWMNENPVRGDAA